MLISYHRPFPELDPPSCLHSSYAATAGCPLVYHQLVSTCMPPAPPTSASIKFTLFLPASFRAPSWTAWLGLSSWQSSLGWCPLLAIRFCFSPIWCHSPAFYFKIALVYRMHTVHTLSSIGSLGKPAFSCAGIPGSLQRPFLWACSAQSSLGVPPASLSASRCTCHLWIQLFASQIWASRSSYWPYVFNFPQLFSPSNQN